MSPPAARRRTLADAAPFLFRLARAAILSLYVAREGVVGGLLPMIAVQGLIAEYAAAVILFLWLGRQRGSARWLQTALTTADLVTLALVVPHDPHHGLPMLFAFFPFPLDAGRRRGRRAYLQDLVGAALALLVIVVLRATRAGIGFDRLDGWTLALFAASTAYSLLAVSARDRAQVALADAGQRLDEIETAHRLALSESEARNAAVVASSLDAIVGMDGAGRICEWNPAAERIFGWSRDEALGQMLGDLMVPDRMRNAHARGLERHTRQGIGPVIGRRLEMPALRRAGGEITVELIVIRTDAPGRREFTGFLRDISSQKLAEARLAQSEQRYRELAEAMPIGVFTATPDGRLTYVNQTLGRYYGRTALQLQKTRWTDFTHPDDGEAAERALIDGLREGEPFEMETRERRQDGAYRVQIARAVPVKNAEGRVLNWLCAVLDVEEIHQAKRALAKYLVAVEAARVAAYTYSFVEQRFDVDGLFEPVLGFTPGTFDGSVERIVAIVHVDDRARLTEAVLSTVARRDDYSVEYRTVSETGRVRWMRTAGRIQREEGRPIQAAGVVQDISVEVEILRSLELRQKELERANRELDDFTYIASHDLKEPLRGIHNFARFLAEDYGESLDDAGREMLKTLSQQAERMQRLIDDLLRVARLGRMPLERQNVELDLVLDEVLESLQFIIDEQRARILRPTPLPRTRCDPVQVAELLRNLVVNALKYNPHAAPTVEILCDRQAWPTVFKVRDDGIGIPEEHRERVFAPFKRLHGPDAFGGGSGVGLTIVRKIVEAHEGRIWIEESPGVGATFAFTLEPEEDPDARRS